MLPFILSPGTRKGHQYIGLPGTRKGHQHISYSSLSAIKTPNIIHHVAWCGNLAGASPNTFQIRRFASQTKPVQDCHPERSEGSLSGERSFAPLRMTKRDGLLFEMYWGQAPAEAKPYAQKMNHTLGAECTSELR